ncbi:hypothetical protein ACDA63_12400 [Uliginosibacterium sp. sgz301328]|uniref:hypothetical protein n=1 Tax=Uliginosibacterium sp. sgz301328 TaxID=3243764 RepID=UPI00359D4E4B
MKFCKRILLAVTIFGLVGPLIGGALVSILTSVVAIARGHGVMEVLENLPKVGATTLVFAYLLGLAPAALTGMAAELLPTHWKSGAWLPAVVAFGMASSFIFVSVFFPAAGLASVCALMSVPSSLLLGWFWQRYEGPDAL